MSFTSYAEYNEKFYKGIPSKTKNQICKNSMLKRVVDTIILYGFKSHAEIIETMEAIGINVKRDKNETKS